MGVKDYKISEHFNPDNPEIPSTYGCGYSELVQIIKQQPQQIPQIQAEIIIMLLI